MAISKRMRYEVLRRDNYACRYCGAAAPDAHLTVDHVIPKALGGGDEPANLVTACQPCNSGKAASCPDAPIVDDVAADALRWAAAMRRAADAQTGEREDEREYVAAFMAQWHDWQRRDGRPFLELSDAEIPTVQNLRQAGLSIADLAYATDAAMSACHIPAGRVWRYFAGICWRMVEQRREIAASLIAADEAEGQT